MKLYVTNISPRITEKSLKNLFSRHGPVLSIQLSKLERAGSTTSVAILEMDAEDALLAIGALNGHPASNRRLYISVIKDKAQGRKPEPTAVSFANTGHKVMKAASGSAR